MAHTDVGRGVLAVIPARYSSSRFPGKPLATIDGKPMLWHVYQQCMKARTIADVVVATDDARIAAACTQWGIPSTMTRDHPTGTDRVAECAQKPEFRDYAGYINVQGDEPFVSPESIDAVGLALRHHCGGTIAAVNAYCDLHEPAEVCDHNVVKLTLRTDGCALAFSRQPIPYPHTSTRLAYCRQLGLYGFTPSGLHAFTTTLPGPVERAEGIEMLRLLERGLAVQMIKVSDTGIAVDTPQDLERAQAFIEHTRVDRSEPSGNTRNLV
ncbi:3-deoxy-manno-octulosonate cytidylyltransferase [Actinophytocola sediminis]